VARFVDPLHGPRQPPRAAVRLVRVALQFTDWKTHTENHHRWKPTGGASQRGNRPMGAASPLTSRAALPLTGGRVPGAHSPEPTVDHQLPPMSCARL
jgi:hypothetical protein